MTERERLLEIMNTPIFPHESVDPLEAVADYLLDSGVRIPVLCRECKHYHAAEGWCDEHSSFIDDRGAKCHPWESENWRMFNEDDFCSYGRRKEN